MPRTRLAADQLEDRRTPATFTWDDGGADNNWSTANNWVGNVAPTAADTDVIIVYNTTDPTTVQNIAGLDIVQLRFDAGADVTLTLNQNLTINEVAGRFEVVDATGLNTITGAGNLVMANGQVDFQTNAAAGALVLAVDIAGTNFRKDGVGVLELAPPAGNTYAGTVDVTAGTLRLNSTLLDRTIRGNLVIGDGGGGAATLQLARDFQINDAATVTVNSDGVLNLAANVVDDFTTLVLNGGTVNVPSTSALEIQTNGTVRTTGTAFSQIIGAGALRLEGGTITFDIAPPTATVALLVTTRITENVAGAGLTKRGAGLLSLSANNTYTGTTRVEAGTLLVGGSQPTSPVVLTGGVLGGVGGTVGAVTAAGGTIDVNPLGGVPATLNTGSLLLGGGAFAPTVAGTGADRLAVTGSVSLSGMTLAPTFSGTVTPGQRFVVIDNDGTDPVVGTFAGLREGDTVAAANGNLVRVTYRGGDGNDVALVVSAPPPAAVGGALDGSARLFPANPATGQFAAASSASVSPFGNTGTNVRTAVADVNNDGFPDTILATGPGTTFLVAVVSGADNTTLLVAPFNPFPAPAGVAEFAAGGFVSAGDFDGDGRFEFVVSPDQSGGPRVSIFSLNPGGAVALRANFFTVDPGFRGGARTTVGDVNADGTPDLAVAAGFGGGPRVVLLDGRRVFGTTGLDDNDKLVGDFFPVPDVARNGVYLAAGDVDGDGFADLVFGAAAGASPQVVVVSGQALMGPNGNVAAVASPVANFTFDDPNSRGGVRVAVVNVDGDNRADIAVSSGEGRPARVRVYRGLNVTGGGEPGTPQDLDPFAGAVLADGVFVG